MTAASFAIGAQRYTTSDLTAADAADVIDLHRRVFASDADAAWYRWKYAAGSGAGVRDATGQLIAHCGGVPRQMNFGGREVSAIQIGDVMVAAAARGWLTRRGPFFQVSRHFYASRIGKDRPYQLAFGFPSERHLRLGVHLGVLRDGGCIAELQWPACAALPWHWRCAPLAVDGAGFDAAVAAAWAAMQASLADHPLGVRDAAYLRWRYAARPARSYLLFALRRAWSRTPVGIVVLRRENTERMMWLDWIGPRDHMATAAAAARCCAAQAGAQVLSAWASPAVAAALDGTGITANVVAARLGIPSASLLSTDEIAATRWWWMAGDTDFL